MLNAEAATAARDAGAALALDAEARKYELEQAITWAARTHAEFTSDEVWAWLEGRGIGELAHPNAMGAAFLTAARAGVIVPTGKVRKATRVTAHRRAVQVWQSRIYQGCQK